MMMQLIDQHAQHLGVAPLCDALDVPRASYYRWKRPVHGPHRPRSSPRALSAAERQDVLDLLHSPRFVDRAPAEVVATLLDDGSYRCSERTMYRILAASSEVRERRDQLRSPTYTKPELLATRPNELWSWDITKLHGPAKWTYFYLYVILDVFSRYVVGWMVALQETAALAEELIRTTCQRQGITHSQLTIHADRGTSMTSKPVALLLADLGVTKTHSRPHVSNDNPFSEAHFKTLKYRPDFPERFGTLDDARRHCGDFFDWYNAEHRHSGLAMLTPHDVHHGLADQRTAQRTAVLAAAHLAHPERFVRGAPVIHTPPREVWINPPPRPRATTQPVASETPPALGEAEAGGGAEGQGLGGAAPVVATEEVLH
jgi:putative transposase